MLRPLRDSDTPALLEACQDPDVPRWTSVPSPYRRADAEAFIAQQDLQRATGQGVTFAIADPDDDGLLGTIGVHPRGEGRAEVGYWLAPWARGRGAMTSAVRLAAAWAFEALAVARVELMAHPENAASQRVAERAGFTREGVLRSYRERKGVREDYVVFSLVRGDG